MKRSNLANNAVKKSFIFFALISLLIQNVFALQFLDDFSDGSITEHLDRNQIPGSLQFKYLTDQIVHTTDADFQEDSDNMNVKIAEDSIKLRHDFLYELEGVSINSSSLDKENQRLYLGTDKGIYVVDINDPFKSEDDNIAYVYDTESEYATQNGTNHSRVWYDAETGQLYSSNYRLDPTVELISVIDTNKTLDFSDDTVYHYGGSFTPWLPLEGESIPYFYLDTVTHFLYISGWNCHVTIVDTKGTNDPGDDTMAGRYTWLSVPAKIPDDDSIAVIKDQVSGILYAVGNNNGMSAVDTKFTDNILDDSSIIYRDTGVYNTTNGADTLIYATPKVTNTNMSSGAYEAVIDQDLQIIYIAGVDGLMGLDTKTTITAADDTTFVYRSTGIYNITNALPGSLIGTNVQLPAYSHIRDVILDEDRNLIYVLLNQDTIAIIDTKGTSDPLDDELKESMNYEDYKYFNELYLDSEDNMLFVSGTAGNIFIDLNEQGYRESGSFISTELLKSQLSWTTRASIPTPRQAPAYGLIDNKIYVVSGTRNWTDQVDLQMYDPELDSWVDKAPLSMSRVAPGFGVIDRKLYVAGGRDVDWNALSSMEVYNPDSNAWQTMAPMPQGLIGPASGVIDGKLYIAGGRIGSADDSVDTLYVYDPDSNSWDSKASMPEPRGGHTAQVLAGKLYVFGGADNPDNPYSNKVFAYDPLTDSWSEKTPMPQGLTGAAATVIGNEIAVAGGTDDYGDTMSTLYIYNPGSDSWRSPGDLPAPRHRAVLITNEEEIFLIGGRDIDWNSAGSCYSIAAELLVDPPKTKVILSMDWEADLPQGTGISVYYSLDSGDTFTLLATSPGSYILPDDKTDSLIYKLILSTNDPQKSPVLNSLTINYSSESIGLFSGTIGTYESKVFDAGANSSWNDIEAQATLPSGTNIVYFTRGGNTLVPDSSWSDWINASTNGDLFLINSGQYRYMQYRAVFSSENNDLSPRLNAVNINYDPVSTFPNKIQITNLGLINNIPDLDYLHYYFTSTMPIIKGNSRKNAQVIFRTNTRTYSTRSDNNGHFTIILNNPPLNKGFNSIQYYAVDESGTKSPVRTLSLTIGIENFPDWLRGEEEDTTEQLPAEEETIEVTDNLPLVSEMPKPSITPSQIHTSISPGPENINTSFSGIEHLSTTVSRIGLIVIMVPTFTIAIFLLPKFLAYGFFWILPRRKSQPWGIIYDSFTRDPIPFTTIRIYDSSGMLLKETISDLQGRYGFVIDEGTYTLEVENSNYQALKKIIMIKTKDTQIVMDIPLVLKSESLKLLGLLTGMNFKTAFDKFILFIGVFGLLFSIHALILNPVTINYIVVIGYLIQLVIFWSLKIPRNWGRILNKETGEVISGVFVRIHDIEKGKQIEVQATDEKGRFGFKLDKAEYLLEFDHANYILDSNSYDLVKLYSGAVAIKVNKDNIGSLDINMISK